MNSQTADYYDIIYQDWIGPNRTLRELRLIESYVDAKETILDIGCGTGRHLIPLSECGYRVTGIDTSNEMIRILKKKLPIAVVKNVDLTQSELPLPHQDYELAICMWNALFEIALTEEQLLNLFTNVRKALTSNGIFIFCTGDSDNFEVQDINLTHSVTQDDLTYILTWKLLDFDQDTNTTIGEEIIEVVDTQGNTRDRVSKKLTQRHWLQHELLDVAEEVGFVCQVRGLETTEDKYFICS